MCGELGAHVPPDEIDELRIVANYLAAHPETPQVVLARSATDGPFDPQVAGACVLSETASR
jgi:hypothetical protein